MKKIFGFLIAHFMVKEPLTLYTLFGVVFVIIGLYTSLSVDKKTK